MSLEHVKGPLGNRLSSPKKVNSTFLRKEGEKITDRVCELSKSRETQRQKNSKPNRGHKDLKVEDVKGGGESS